MTGTIDDKLNKTIIILEKQIFDLLKMNKDLEEDARAEMPYKKQHRVKTRIWQTLLVMEQFLD